MVPLIDSLTHPLRNKPDAQASIAKINPFSKIAITDQQCNCDAFTDLESHILRQHIIFYD